MTETVEQNPGVSPVDAGSPVVESFRDLLREPTAPADPYEMEVVRAVVEAWYQTAMTLAIDPARAGRDAAIALKAYRQEMASNGQQDEAV